MALKTVHKKEEAGGRGHSSISHVRIGGRFNAKSEVIGARAPEVLPGAHQFHRFKCVFCYT